MESAKHQPFASLFMFTLVLPASTAVSKSKSTIRFRQRQLLFWVVTSRGHLELSEQNR